MDNGASSCRRFLNGDTAGFVELVRDYKDGLILYLSSFTGDLHTAEELAENTFVKLGVKKPRFSGKASFKTWLYAIGRNAAIDHLRKHAGRSELSLDDCTEWLRDAADLELSYLKKEQSILIHRAMRRLKPDHQQVLWLIYFEGFRAKDAARVMHKSVHSVETLVYRARLALKSELEKEGFSNEEL